MMLDEVIITGKRLMMVVKGDTLQYNVDEVKTLEGAKMGEILEKLPGVSMDGGLKVNGMPIHRIYVNGDTLFKGTIGRTDFYGGNVQDMINSLRRLKRYPGEFKLYPGHGDTTQLSYERQLNPYMNKV